MYLQILKKDLQRKKAMNLILLIFMILAATFIASSANNMVSVITALDSFFDKANVPDYWFCTTDKKEAQRFESFANKNHYDFQWQELIQANPKNVKVNNVEFDYSNSLCLSQLKNSTKVFDKNNNEITTVKDGEIYITNEIFTSSKNNFKIGDTIQITVNEKTKSFQLKGCMKDALFGSSMIGETRFLISQNDYEYFNTQNANLFYSLCTYTTDNNFTEKFNALDLNTIFNVNRSGIKNMYLMDMVLAAVMLIVSICLILISMVILRFTIHFTMNEEFREIGVMKAIGIQNKKIRGLYIIKYFAISAAGGTMGFLLSLPFGDLMLKKLSQNIILSGNGNYLLNIVCAFFVVAIVILFCYLCTRKINRFSPIDAIRNGENGERYSRKSFLHIGKTKLSPIPFMAINDILSNSKRFIAMLIIFTLGILLIIIPVNTTNTLKSDHLITWFSMAECDHVISIEQLISANGKKRSTIESDLNAIKTRLLEKGIHSDTFVEVMFRMNISYNDKKTSSLSFQGVGDVTTDMYTYLKGTAPQNADEVAISHIVSDNIGANIGDTVTIKNGEKTKKYIVTAIFQTMNNLGEGIRFYQKEELDYSYAAGTFGIQLLYTDQPDKKELEKRKELLKELFPDANIYTPGEYIDYMIGNIAGQIQEIKQLILIVILCINTLVTVLMVKSFITKEKGEIAMLKAIGFKNLSLITWQTLRIGIILFLSTILAIILSAPLSQLFVGPVFKIMGAQNITFEIVPFEVYVMYPLIILCVTVLASMLAAIQIRSISSSEISNIE